MSCRASLGPWHNAAENVAGIAALLLALLISGCGDSAAARPPSSASVPSGSAATPTFTRSAEPATASTDASAAVEPSAAASAASAEPDDAEPSASAEPSAAGGTELPDVEISNIGMHIGGEANTNEQKRPIRGAVSKHYDEMRRCYAMADKPSKEVTFGVDMRISRDGGPAKISNPRSGFKSNAVKQCLVEVFEKVEFPVAKKRIPMMVSFSLRFRRK